MIKIKSSTSIENLSHSQLPIMTQLNLLTNLTCDHCGDNPGVDPTNPGLWNGFYDLDTKQHVCRKCCSIHYYRKAEAKGSLEIKTIEGKKMWRDRRATYHEMPVIAKT